MRGLLGIVTTGLLATAMLTSGCLFPPVEERQRLGVDGGGLPVVPTTYPWALEDCLFLNWFLDVDPEAVRPYIPEGLVLDLDEGPDGEPVAMLGFEAFECRRGTGVDEMVSNMRYGSLFIAVEPEDEALQAVDADVDQYYVKLFPLIPDDERRELFQAFGLLAVDGTVTHTSRGADGALDATYAASYTLDGIGTFSFEGVVDSMGPLSDTEGGGAFAEYSPLGDDPTAPTGIARWEARYEVDHMESGVGVWTIEESPFVEAIVGATSGQTQFITGQWSFGPGTVVFPAR